MRIYARRALVEEGLAPGARALLLEGSWPPHERSSCRVSLDETIDARADWIDAAACRLAERAAESTESSSVAASSSFSILGASIAWLNALKLRYYLVKLLRVVAFFHAGNQSEHAEGLQLAAERDRDEDYAELLAEIAATRGLKLDIDWTGGVARTAPSSPPDGPLRRAAARINGRLDRLLPEGNLHGARAVLCGNSRLLDSTCRELLARGAAVWWLYDRFAYRTWLRWRPFGVRQIVLNSSLGRTNCLTAGELLEGLNCRGIDLARPLQRWLNNLARSAGAAQTRMVEQIHQHFVTIHPNVLVLDEDATPLPRAAIAVGRQCGARSSVVQHGVPCLPFGFVPLAVDRFFAWGPATRRQLVRWGVPSHSIEITGSPQHERCRPFSAIATRKRASIRRRKVPHILLLTTVPPRDDRPDSVSFHFTTAAHEEMLRMTCAALSRLPRVRLLVKLHPRVADATVFRRTFAGWPGLNVRWVRGDLARRVVRCDCVLSCASSTGVEAAALGVPVIQLWPQGASDLLPAADWGFAGTACCERDLERLLADVLAGKAPPSAIAASELFGDSRQSASRKTAELLLADANVRRQASPRLAVRSDVFRHAIQEPA